MAISKKFLKSKPVCKVTFSIPAEAAKKVYIVGDFNEWKTDANPLKKLKNGTFKAVLDLPTEKSYEYKFIIDGEYINDEEAENFVYNDFANTDNCLIQL